MTWNMEQYAWSHRPLLIFADAQQVTGLSQQRKALQAHVQGLQERDVVVIEVVNDNVQAGSQSVAADPGQLRQRYDVGSDMAFAVLLVGKDTGVKLRSEEPVSPEKLFQVIDAMPMRQREMMDQ